MPTAFAEGLTASPVRAQAPVPPGEPPHTPEATLTDTWMAQTGLMDKMSTRGQRLPGPHGSLCLESLPRGDGTGQQAAPRVTAQMVRGAHRARHGQDHTPGEALSSKPLPGREALWHSGAGVQGAGWAGVPSRVPRKKAWGRALPGLSRYRDTAAECLKGCAAARKLTIKSRLSRPQTTSESRFNALWCRAPQPWPEAPVPSSARWGSLFGSDVCRRAAAEPGTPAPVPWLPRN